MRLVVLGMAVTCAILKDWEIYFFHTFKNSDHYENEVLAENFKSSAGMSSEFDVVLHLKMKLFDLLNQHWFVEMSTNWKKTQNEHFTHSDNYDVTYARLKMLCFVASAQCVSIIWKQFKKKFRCKAMQHRPNILWSFCQSMKLSRHTSMSFETHGTLVLHSKHFGKLLNSVLLINTTAWNFFENE